MYWRPPRRWSRWPDLPPDLLREVSGRIHHAADLVRFHAVCKPWRDSSSPPSRAPATTHLLPWLLAPSVDHLEFLSFRCVFSKTTYRAPRHSSGLRNSLATVDGAAAPYLTTYSADRRPRLHDYPLAGDVTPLPRLRHDIDRYCCNGNGNLCGVVYGDGTIFLYKFSYLDSYGNETCFTAALLRPGDAAWTLVDRRLELPEPGQCCAAYHRGKILLTVEASLWYVVTPVAAAADDVLVPTTSLAGEPDEYLYKYCYVLESRGELLWVSVQVRSGYPGQCGEGVRGLVRAILVTVHKLEEATGGGGEKTVQWVRKDGGSLRDRVLFLGWPSSFAVDAARLGSDDDVTGGCAYLVYKDMEWDDARDQCCVFRYDLVAGKVKFVEWLPQAWEDDMCFWLLRHPAIAPNQEISHRVDPKWYSRPAVPTPISDVKTERPVQHYKPCFRVLLRNLPLTVDASRLRRFLSKHGQVADAQVICSRDTGISQGLALVTMAMLDEHDDDAVAALDGLILDGCSLEASLVKKRRRRRRRTSSTRSGQHK